MARSRRENGDINAPQRSLASTVPETLWNDHGSDGRRQTFHPGRIHACNFIVVGSPGLDRRVRPGSEGNRRRIQHRKGCADRRPVHVIAHRRVSGSGRRIPGKIDLVVLRSSRAAQQDRSCRSARCIAGQGDYPCHVSQRGWIELHIEGRRLAGIQGEWETDSRYGETCSDHASGSDGQRGVAAGGQRHRFRRCRVLIHAAK